MLFATFAVGLRCFADFDKDLRPAKMNGKLSSFLRSRPETALILSASDSNFDRKRPTSTYATDAPTGGKGQPPMNQRNSTYNMGGPLEERMSIE
jgi:hypothetical protein